MTDVRITDKKEVTLAGLSDEKGNVTTKSRKGNMVTCAPYGFLNFRYLLKVDDPVHFR